MPNSKETKRSGERVITQKLIVVLLSAIAVYFAVDALFVSHNDIGLVKSMLAVVIALLVKMDKEW